MKLASVAEAKALDSRTQSEYGISAEGLIERAGTLAADRIFTMYAEILEPPAYVVVLCGSGNNGQDGRVCARELAARGVRVEIVELATHEDGAGSQDAGHDNETFKDVSGIDSRILSAAVIVDALFGIGLNRPLEGRAFKLVQLINESNAVRVALDTPSGLDSETGLVLGEAVEADLTLTFGIAKRGFAVNEGPSHIGRLEVLDIGFPLELIREVASSTLGFDRKLARKFLPHRSSAGNKSTFGRVQIFAGSKGMGGAAILAGCAASRIGAGSVVVATDGDPKAILAEMPEFMTADLHEASIFDKPKWSAAIVGPGLGSASNEVLSRLLAIAPSERQGQSQKGSVLDSPVVLDADGLTALSKLVKRETALPANWILTPHAGELSRLLNVDAKTIEGDRFKYAELAAKKFGCVVLLKGFRTVVSNGEKSVVILSGNSALAKAGMGDVLSGAIAGLLAQGLRPFAAACLGAYVHGFLADEWLKSGRDILSFQPSDLSASLPFVLKNLRSQPDLASSRSNQGESK